MSLLSLNLIPFVVFPSLTSGHGMILLLSIVTHPDTKMSFLCLSNNSLVFHSDVRGTNKITELQIYSWVLVMSVVRCAAEGESVVFCASSTMENPRVAEDDIN